MKTKIAIFCIMAALLGASHTKAQVDLVPGINYSYNPPGANGIIQIVNEDVCNNGSSSAGSFDVANYIYNTSSHVAYIVGDTTLSGINGSACITLNNRIININNTAGIPAGTYELGVYVNYHHNVTETDTTNNAGLFSGSWSYSPSGVDEISIYDVKTNVYPNPCNGVCHLVISSPHELTGCNFELYNVLGEKINTLALNSSQGGTSETTLTIKQSAGFYFYKIVTASGNFLANGRLVIQ